MKVIKRVLLLVLIIIVAGASIVIGQGYQMYIEAVEKVPVEQKAQEIMEIDHYLSLIHI